MKRSTRADIVFVSITLIWSTSFALAKAAVAWATPALFVVLRFVLAGAIWFALYRTRLKDIRPGTWSRGLLLGAVLGAGFVFQTAGLEHTGASMSGFLTGLTVVIVPLLVIAIERTIPRVTSIAGVLFCLAGLWILTSPSGAGFNVGDLLTLLGAVFFALYIVFVEMFTDDYDTRALTLIQAVGILAVAVPGALLMESPAVEFTWAFTWRWLALGIMAAVTLALQIHWQRFISATRAAVIITLETPLAAFFAFLLLGEVLAPAAYAGGALIFLGTLVAEGGARLLPPRTRPGNTSAESD